MTTVGELIRKARKERGLTQKELGRLLGLSRGSVTNWERNKDTPRPNKHKALSEVLGLPPAAFSPLTAPSVNGTEPDSVPRHTIIVLEWSDLALVHRHDGPIRAPTGRRRMGLDATDDLQLAVDDCFAVRIVDDSMAPTFHAGERVVLNRRLEPLDGDTVMARLENGNHLFRHYKARGRKAFDLIAENAEHFETVTVNPKSPGEVIGVMVVHERKRRRASNNHRK